MASVRRPGCDTKLDPLAVLQQLLDSASPSLLLPPDGLGGGRHRLLLLCLLLLEVLVFIRLLLLAAATALLADDVVLCLVRRSHGHDFQLETGARCGCLVFDLLDPSFCALFD